MTQQKIKIPPFRISKHLRPRRQKRERVVLVEKVTSGGKRVLEAPAVVEVKQPWQWSKE